MPMIKRIADGRPTRFVLLALVAMALAGCSKCDVPVWRHDSAAPQSCHDEAPPQ